MNCTLKDYEEECVEEGTVPSELTTEVGEWEDQELNQMETHLNDCMKRAHFIPTNSSIVLTPRPNLAS